MQSKNEKLWFSGKYGVHYFQSLLPAKNSLSHTVTYKTMNFLHKYVNW